MHHHKPTTAQQKFIKDLLLNPRWSVIKDSEGRFSFHHETLSKRVIVPLLQAGWFDQIPIVADHKAIVMTPHGKREWRYFLKLESRPKIKKKPKKRKIPKRRTGGPRSDEWHRKNDPLMISMRREGISAKKIAKKLRCQETTVRRVLKPLGLVREYRERKSSFHR